MLIKTAQFLEYGFRKAKVPTLVKEGEKEGDFSSLLSCSVALVS